MLKSTSWEFPASQSIKQCVCENQLIVGCSGLYLSCLHGPSVQPREDSIKDKEELCLVEFLKLVSRKCDLTIATKINPTWAIQDWLTQLTCIPVLQTSRPDTVRNACHFFFFFTRWLHHFLLLGIKIPKFKLHFKHLFFLILLKSHLTALFPVHLGIILTFMQ